MLVTPQKLLHMLADGHTHSGTVLARELGVTRAAVWKAIQQLEALGVEVTATRGSGYRLPEAVELLQPAAIDAQLAPVTRATMEALDVRWSVASTNDCLLAAPAPAPGHSRVCLAEFQTSGRGRRGREWFAAAGHGLCFSLAWSFQASPAQLPCLGLVAGIGVLRAVRRAGAAQAMLKWPNDVVIDGRKLAGILIDVQGEAGGPMRAVIGVGLNYSLPDRAAAQVAAAGGLPAAALSSTAEPATLSRNACAAALIEELQGVLEVFSRSGFSELADAWRTADYLVGKAVTVSLPQAEYRGVVRGIAADGQLQLATDDGIMHFMTGDVTVRLAA